MAREHRRRPSARVPCELEALEARHLVEEPDQHAVTQAPRARPRKDAQVCGVLQCLHDMCLELFETLSWHPKWEHTQLDDAQPPRERRCTGERLEHAHEARLVT